MGTKFPVEVLLLLTLIPLPPGPSFFRIPCCRDNSRIVRKIVQSKLLPVLDKYNVKLGLECPFHPAREIYAPQQTAKQQDRASQWTCTLCGKSFYEEKFLDLHFEHRHKERVNTAEDAVCLSNYCDIMRCDVLAAFEGTLFGGRTTSTDIEVWNDRTAVVASTAETKTRKIIKGTAETTRRASSVGGSRSNNLNNKSHQSSSKGDSSSATCDRSRPRKNLIEGGEEEDDDDEGKHLGESSRSCTKGNHGHTSKERTSVPLDKKQQRIADMQRLKANCKKDELEKLRAKCQVLIRDCIGGLLVNLSTQEFKEMEDELNRKICWYLSCDRYWEDGVPDRRAFPWILLIVAATILSCGICLCYYIIWVLFDSDDYKFFMTNSSSNQTLAQSLNMPQHPLNHDHPSPTHSRSYASLHHPQQQNMLNMVLSEKVAATSFNSTDCLEMSDVIPGGVNAATAAAAGQSEHYIYVTYPPELKRRLLESCYNRTTRL